MPKVFKVGLIGCGHISETYFRAHEYFNNFKIIKCADINIESAKKSKKTYVISIQTDGYQWLEGSAFWESPTLRFASTKENDRALNDHLACKIKLRKDL